MEPSHLRTATKRRTRAQMLELKESFEKSNLAVHSFSRLHNISTYPIGEPPVKVIGKNLIAVVSSCVATVR